MKEHILQALQDFKADRPIMQVNNTLDRYKEMLQEETEEVLEAKDETELREELADVIIIALNAMLVMGIDPEEAVMEKIAVNHLQHPAYMYQEGDYKEQYMKSKKVAKRDKVKDTFYERARH